MATQADNRPIDPYMQMMAIAREMKEIPELPSEAPKDVSHLTKVEFREEGGVYTYIDGHEEPYKGYPYFEFVEKIDILKKMGRGALSSLYHSFKKRNPLELVFLAFVPWLFEALVNSAIYSAHRIVMRFRFKPKYYCTAIRELYRAFGNQEQLRDIFCMVLENDNAYRYRFQDVVVHLDKVSLKRNPGKELNRLLTIMQSRETGQDLVDTWTLLKTFIPPYLFMNRKMRNEVVRILTELNLEEVKLSKEDKWYASGRKDYICDFRTHPTEEDKGILERFNNKVERDEKGFKVREESTKAHEELFVRQLQELGLSEEEKQLMAQREEELTKSINLEAAQKYDIGRLEIRKQILGERFDIMGKHIKEVEEMDKEYNSKLQAIT